MFKTEFEKRASRVDTLKKIVAEAQKLIDQQQSRMPSLDMKSRQDMAKKIEHERSKMNRAHKLMKKASAADYLLFPRGTMDSARKKYNSDLLSRSKKRLATKGPKGKMIRLIDLTPETLKRVIKSKV